MHCLDKFTLWSFSRSGSNSSCCSCWKVCIASSLSADAGLTRLVNGGTVLEEKARRCWLPESKPTTPESGLAKFQAFLHCLSLLKEIDCSFAFSLDPALWIFRRTISYTAKTIFADCRIQVVAIVKKFAETELRRKGEPLASRLFVAELQTLVFVSCKMTANMFAVATFPLLKAIFSD